MKYFFIEQIKSRRRQLIYELAGWSARCALFPAGMCLVVLAFLALCQVRIPFILVIPAACWLIAGIVLFVRNFPDLKKTAVLCDQIFDGKNQFTTALFILQNKVEGEFADCTVKWAVERLETARHAPRYFQERRDYGRWTLLFVLTAGAIFFLPQFTEEAGLGYSPAEATRDLHEEISIRLPGKSPEPENPRQNPAQIHSAVSALKGVSHEKTSQGKVLQSPASDNSGSPHEAASGGSGDGGNTRPGASSGKERKAGAAALMPADKPPAGKRLNSGNGGSTGISGLQNAENEESSLSDGGGDNLDKALSEEPENQRKNQRQNARGGLRPLLRDNAPPAGRELSDKDGHGDQPGDGRGGPSGHKKARGTASWLPVVPIPDQVGGKLSSGRDIEIKEKVPPREADAGISEPLPRRDMDEYAGRRQDATRKIRLELAKYYLQMHEQNQSIKDSVL
jgi:hypothetical protein